MGKENETFSYNLSGSIQSKRFEFSGKFQGLKSKTNIKIKKFNCFQNLNPKTILYQFVKKIKKLRYPIEILDLFEDLSIDKLLKKFSKTEKNRFIKIGSKNLKKFKLINKVTMKLIRYYEFKVKKISTQSNQNSSKIILNAEQIVQRKCLSKKINSKFKLFTSSKKKIDTITTKEILTCQSTNMLNNQIKESYMFNNSYKTSQKKKRESKRIQTRTTNYGKEEIESSVFNYSEIGKTNLSNHLKTDIEQVFKLKKKKENN